jgi:protein-disulfide isomerase
MTEHLSLDRRALLAGAAAAAFSPALALAQAAPSTAKVDEKELAVQEGLPDIVLGKADAPVTIIEYASMTCSHCAHFTVETLPKLREKYIDTGKVKFILREFPLDALAAGAFMLARCQGDKREAVVDLLFRQQANWAFVDKPLDALEASLRQTGMNAEAFKKCLDDKELYQNVMKVAKRAQEKFQISSTPTFFINGERKVGALEMDAWDKILEPLLAKPAGTEKK